ncbi:MAG: NADH-quinone oxidoreductase subunit M [Magnetococcales bacterium]|nr:NADH-quinone oxidoreductase subunit M [Magnetococcales bacterium]
MKPLLVLLFLPAFGAGVIALLPARMAGLMRGMAVLVSFITLIVAIWVIIHFIGTNSDLQFLANYPWRSQLDNSFAFGVDGLSLPMVLLATLLAFVAILASGGVKEMAKGYYALLLLLETSMLGVFMAQDWSIFYIFWELTLLPLFFLINTFGGKQRNQAALNFVLYTMGGSVFMLIGLLLAYDASTPHTFLMNEMAIGTASLSGERQVLIFLGFLIGFGVKMPIFPLHGWLPLAHVEAPAPVSLLLSGALLKMGSYGLIRAAMMLPEAVVTLQVFLATLAMINVIYGGVLAWRQIDLKRMIAYSSVSHMGVVLLGIAALNLNGITGAMLQMVSHGLTAGALFLVIGLLYERTHTRDIRHYGSLTQVAPRFAFFVAAAFMASVGVPGTAGFMAELHVMIGSLQRWGGSAALLSVGMLVGAAYAVRTIGCLCTGPKHQGTEILIPMRRTELAAATILVMAIVVLGFLPAPLLGMMTASLDRFGDLFVNGL